MTSDFRHSRRSPGTKDLFPPQRGTLPEAYLIAHIDGGARGNPGPAGYGVVITDQAGHKIATLSEYLGQQTNNYAEYNGLLAALHYALAHGYKGLRVISDSELLVRQIKGVYKVKSPSLQELYDRAKELIGKLDWFSIEHVLRGKNREADGLANAAMDKSMGRRMPSAASAVVGQQQEFEGVVREGVIKLLDGELPEGTRVQVRVKG
ncbi:MAG: ribonuclease HI [Acidobacteria bacterium]|nr:MAG: ribonuclease HI [Acidobacteriota bacterium]